MISLGPKHMSIVITTKYFTHIYAWHDVSNCREETLNHQYIIRCVFYTFCNMDRSLDQSLSGETLTTLYSSIKFTATLFFLASILVTISISLKPATRVEIDLQSHSRASGETDGYIRFLSHNFTISEWGAKKRYLHEPSQHTRIIYNRTIYRIHLIAI